jgi:cation transporter-like permease
MAAYEGSFLPFQNQLQAMQVGQNNANLAQTGQMTGANLAAQLGLGGIQSQINANTAANNLFSNLFGTSMNALSGAAGTGFEQGVEDFLGSLGGGLLDLIGLGD